MGRKALGQNLVFKFSFFLSFCLCWLFVSAFSSYREGGYSPDAVLRLLTAVASLVAEQRF